MANRGSVKRISGQDFIGNELLFSSKQLELYAKQIILNNSE
jgi:hypothetical protein